GGVRAAAVRARPDRPRPGDPHERGGPPVELPALAVGLFGARVLRRAVARLRHGRAGGGAPGVRVAPAPLRSALVVSTRARRPPQRRPPPRRRRRSDTGARVIAALPGIAFAAFIVAQGGLVFALGLFVVGMVCM